MKKLNCILTLLLLAMGLTRAMADDQTLSLGNYEEVVAGTKTNAIKEVGG